MVLLPAAAVLGAAYYSRIKDAMVKRWNGYRSKRRVSRRGVRALAGKNYSKRGTKAGPVPRTLQIPRNSVGTRWWPRYNTLGPIGKSQVVQLTYCSQLFTLSNSTGGVTGPDSYFALNGLFDPDLSGVGHQPMGFDQWTPFFRLYKVFKVDVKIRPIITSNTATNSFIAAKITASQDGSLASGLTYDYCSEQRNIAVRLLSNDNEDVIYRSFTISEIEGHNIADDNYGAAVTGNPGNLPKLRLACGNVSATDTGSINVIVEFVFHAVFYNRTSLPQS